MYMDEEDTYYRGFGEDGDDSLEREAAQMATKERQVSIVKCHFFGHSCPYIFLLQSVVELTHVPPRLWGQQTSLKRKACEPDANNAPGIMAEVEGDLSGAETEPDEMREGEEEHQPQNVNMAGHHLTTASRFTNQV